MNTTGLRSLRRVAAAVCRNRPGLPMNNSVRRGVPVRFCSAEPAAAAVIPGIGQGKTSTGYVRLAVDGDLFWEDFL